MGNLLSAMFQLIVSAVSMALVARVFGIQVVFWEALGLLVGTNVVVFLLAQIILALFATDDAEVGIDNQ